MLKSFVCELGLSLSDCRGQSYDGAAVMSGKYSSVQTRLRQLEPRALFVLCNSHSLNLAVVDACKNSYIRNMFGTLQSLHTFFNGAKRQAVLEHCKQNSNISSSSKQRRLQSLSDTRWSSRFSALESFQCLNPVVLEALEKLSTSPGMDISTVSDANGLLSNIGTFEFILSIDVAKMILGVTQPFANFLQVPKLNLLQFKTTAESVYDTLCEMKSVQVFADAFNICSEKAAELGIEVRSTTRTKRLGLADECPDSYYRRELYFAVLDELTSQFQERLLGRVGDVVTAFGIFNKEALQSPDLAAPHIPLLAQFYGSEENADIQGNALAAEYKVFLRWCTRNIDLTNPIDLVDLLCLLKKKQAECIYPNIFTLLKIGLTLPITSCTSERTFSELRLLKSYLRSTMVEERLSSLATIFCNKDLHVNIENVISKFVQASSRRLEFLF